MPKRATTRPQRQRRKLEKDRRRFQRKHAARIVRRAQRRLALRKYVRTVVPAEFVGMITALLAALYAQAFVTSPVIVSYAASLGENVGFYAFMMAYEVDKYRREPVRGKTAWGVLLVPLRRLVKKFLGLEVLDTLLSRPGCVWLCQSLTGDIAAGTTCGKLLADVVWLVLLYVVFTKVEADEAADGQDAKENSDSAPGPSGGGLSRIGSEMRFMVQWGDAFEP